MQRQNSPTKLICHQFCPSITAPCRHLNSDFQRNTKTHRNTELGRKIMVYVFLLRINCLSSSVTQKHGKISQQITRDTGKAIMTTVSFILSLHLPSIFWKTIGSKNSLSEVSYGPSNQHVTFFGWTAAPSQNRTSVSQENSQHFPVVCQN